MSHDAMPRGGLTDTHATPFYRPTAAEFALCSTMHFLGIAREALMHPLLHFCAHNTHIWSTSMHTAKVVWPTSEMKKRKTILPRETYARGMTWLMTLCRLTIGISTAFGGRTACASTDNRVVICQMFSAADGSINTS